MVLSFEDYTPNKRRWITFVVESPYYPDYLSDAELVYGSILRRFQDMVNAAEDSAGLLRTITSDTSDARRKLLRAFKQYVSPDTSVEMLGVKSNIPDIIAEYGHKFRPLAEVREKLASRPDPDYALIAIFHEHQNRGEKGYVLTARFFGWFRQRFGNVYTIEGPEGAGPDVMLDRALPNFGLRIPADFVIRRRDGSVVAVGFARYDSDRGGSQEDDRTGGNRDKVPALQRYAEEHNPSMKIIFINDGPGLTLGSMWRDYAELEKYGEGRVMVATLKMLDERLTREWLES